MLITDARRETRREREVWRRVRNSERYYAAQLRKIARQIQHVVQAFGADDPTRISEMTTTLNRYADILRPWARAVARRMLYETARRDDKAWRAHARMMGEEIERELNEANIGGAYQTLMERQVDLITSIPREAAQRVHQLATEHLYEGRRFPEIAAEIMRQNDVSKAKADLIARTEVGRAATTFQQVRAQAIGSEGYIWRAVMDYKTRPELGIRHFAQLNTLRMGSHRKLDGSFHRWDDPPVAGTRGERAHPGAIYNCFPGDALVDWSGARRLFRVFYNGPFVRFVVAGQVIECTPNHPILTRRGWIAAGLLNTCDDIACMPRNLSEAADYDKQKTVSTFSDLFEACGGARANHIAGTRFDFHGDLINSDVDEIAVDRELLYKRNVVLSQQVSDLLFAESDSSMSDAISSSANQIVGTSFPRSLNAADMLFLGFVGGDNLVSLYGVTESDSSPFEGFGNGHVSHTVLNGDGWNSGSVIVGGDDIAIRQIHSQFGGTDALALGGIDAEGTESETQSVWIAPDDAGSVLYGGALSYEFCRLQDKSFGEFSGHVYTLETWTGQYGVGARNIQAKNCRCYAEPVLPTTY